MCVFLYNPTLFYSIPLLALTDRQKDRRRNKYTRFAWAGGTFSPVVLLCYVSVWFLREQGFWSTPKIFFGFSDPANFLHQPASSALKKNPKIFFGFSDPANFLHQPPSSALKKNPKIFFGFSDPANFLRLEKKRYDHYICISSTWIKSNTNPLVQLQYIRYI